MKKILIDSLAVRVLLLSCQSIIAILILTSLSSCSGLTSRRSVFGGGGEEDNKKSKKSQMVPKAQYDQLLSKYEKLLKQTKNSSSSLQSQSSSSSSGSSGPGGSGDVPMSDNPEDIMNELNNIEPELTEESELAETVDVFNKKQGQKSNQRSSSRQSPVVDTGKTPSYDEIDVGGQIQRLREAKKKISQNKYDAALSILKNLENSQVRQITVRARYYMGELFFDQEEYDLAMQIYEEILQKDAFSGVVIKTLGRLIACSEKLQLKKKKEQYYSILHDFFEQS